MNTIIKLILLNLFIAKGLGTQNNKTIDVVAVGDMMIGTNYPSEKYLPARVKIDIPLLPKGAYLAASTTFSASSGVLT